MTLTSLPIPMASIDDAWKKYKAKKEQQGLDLLRRELEAGRLTVEHMVAKESSAAMIFIFLRAATEGTTRLNLRILAKVIKGYAVEEDGQEDAFAHLTAIVKTLSRKEVILLAEFYKVCKELDAQQEQTEKKKVPDYVKELAARSVPRLAKSDDEVRAVLDALTRTGFVIMPSHWWLPVSHVPTPLMDELVVLAAFREAVAEEEGERELAQRT